jgi:hypothetical protein
MTDCSFDITGHQRAKVLGTQDPGTHEFGAPPAPLLKGQEVTFIGKWPLESYLDNNTEIFTFTTTTGVVVSGVLNGFTMDCKASYTRTLGTPRIRIRLQDTEK